MLIFSSYFSLISLACNYMFSSLYKGIGFCLLCIAAFIAVKSPSFADSATEPGVLEVTKEALQNSIGPGEKIEFSIRVENLSTEVLAPSKIVDTLPTGFVYNDDAKLAGVGSSSDNPINLAGTQSGSAVTWFLGSDGDVRNETRMDGVAGQGDGESFIVSYSARGPSTAGSYTNEACVFYIPSGGSSESSLCAEKDFIIESVEGGDKPQKTPDASIETVFIFITFGSVLTVPPCVYFMLLYRRKSFEEVLIHET